MKRGWWAVGAGLGLALVAGVLASVSAQAQDKGAKSWTRVSVFTDFQGRTAFFDHDTGRLYVYDQKECVRIQQVQKLGDDLENIRR